MKKFKKISLVLLIMMLCFVTLAFPSQASAMTNNLDISATSEMDSVNDDLASNNVGSIINNINDAVVKEKIIDLLSLCYVVVSTDNDSSVPIRDNEKMIDNIYSLSQLNGKQLDLLIEETIVNTTDIIRTNPDAYFLSSASAVFEKYNFLKELEELENTPKSTHFSNEDMTVASSKIVDRTWIKTATGTLEHHLLGTTNATYNMKISWVVKNSKITSYTKTPSGSANPIYYAYISSNIISEGIPPFYLGQRANVKCSGKFQKPVMWNPYDYIILDIWFYNDGGFDVSVSH